MFALVLSERQGAAPAWLLPVYIVIGMVSAIAYWLDKRAAEARSWRISENRLHLLDFAGGIVGGLLAQAALSHKTAKPGFAAITLTIAAVHLVLLGVIGLGILDLPHLA